jgi:hypothetical protein
LRDDRADQCVRVLRTLYFRVVSIFPATVDNFFNVVFYSVQTIVFSSLISATREPKLLIHESEQSRMTEMKFFQN